MFPTTNPAVVHAEQSRRLEGYRRWAVRRGHREDIAGPDDAPRPVAGHRPHPVGRLVLGR